MPLSAPGPLACIVIPVHNRRKLTLDCLEGLRWCATAPDWKIILVDDGSTDGTGDAVRADFPHVDIVEGTGDLFWTGAMNIGMRYATSLSCTEVVWLNDDTFPDEASLRRIVSLVREDAMLVVSSTPLVNGETRVSCSLNFKPAPPVSGTLQKADVLAGYQIAFSAKLIHCIGYPDAHRWPHYAGDSSYTRQAHRAGFKLRVDGDSFVPMSEFEHCPGAAEVFWKGDRSLATRIRDLFFAKRSRFRVLSFWHLDLLSRGFARTLIVSPGRVLSWIWKILRHRPAPSVASDSLRGSVAS